MPTVHRVMRSAEGLERMSRAARIGREFATAALFSPSRALVGLLVAAALWTGLCATARAQTGSPLNEQEISIAKQGGLISVTLEATLYRPDGPGPFPLVIINHGKESGDPKFQRRYRP
ncbi:MAG: hypothetical protein KAY46_22280, partial [Burkholderiaceae bacterium]|nr:hypothetical protein [Burkholderiaceae bacterium]